MRTAVSALAFALLLSGCQEPQARLNAPPHGQAEVKCDLRSEYDHMIDNALLETMTVSDVHFVPHRPLLNSLGEERIARLAALMETYGGTVRFSTDSTDEKLVAARTALILEQLRAHGIDATSETVKPDLPGGPGLDANQAILIRANEGMYKPKSSGGSGGNNGSSGATH